MAEVQRVPGSAPWTVGVIADTHVPDRAREVNPRALSLFKDAGVQAIIHAGDVCVPRVLDELGKIAPTYAARGNRDWVALSRLPYTRCLAFGDLMVGVVHGHGSLLNYLLDKVDFIRRGTELDVWRYERRVLAAFPQASVIVYGHLHVRRNEWVDGRLVFNPGSACCPHHLYRAPSVGLLRMDGKGQVEGEIIEI